MPKKNIRPIRVDGQLAYVTLTKGYTAVIDAEDVPLVEGRNWHAHVTPRSIYAVTNVSSFPKRSTLRMHCVIMGGLDGLDVDHEDGDGLNNRRKNLRSATRSQNAGNSRISHANSSGVKGVHWHSRSQKWRATIRQNGKVKTIGRYSTLDEAAAAYAKASFDVHGEFGRTA